MLIERYARSLLRLGIIAVHDLGELETDSRLERGFAALGRLGAEGRLPVRVHAGIRRGALSLAMERGLRSGDPLGTLPSSTELGGGAKIGWLKLFGDGTLGSRTAALLEAYTPDAERGDPPGGPAGMLVTEPGEMRELAATAASAGLATSIHAIGDRAVRAALDALEPTSGRIRLRPRVEHVQLVDRDDLPRFGASGVVASVQPGHLAGDAANARRAWGERIERGYPWRDLLDGGASLVFGSDAPAGDVDPWPALVLAVTRRDPGWPRTEPAFEPRQVITLGEAIRAACVAGPTAAGETDRGRLTVGQRADLIVVPAAILADMDALRVARPRLVMMDGRVVAES
jgi:predicted amidohydrolase YtcJ